MESDDQTHEAQSYMCFLLSQIEKSHLEAGNNIIMPASALSSSSSSQQLVCRMTFCIAKSNDTSTLHYHCGVAEFTADDGFVFLPTWMMKKLNIREGDLVDVKMTSLPEGNYIKVQPHTTEFITVLPDPVSVLKKALRDHVACLTSGDGIVVNHKDKKYLIHIVETKPSRAISLFENDNYEIEFAKPLDYYKQVRCKRFLEGIGEILEEDDIIDQPMKKKRKLRYQLSSEANKQQTMIGEILEEDDITDQPMKKKRKLRCQLSSEANKQQTMFKPFTGKVRSRIEDIKDVRFHKIGTGLEKLSSRTYAMKLNLSAMEVM